MKRTQIRRKPTRTCVVCRTPFLSPYTGSKTCSTECARALKKRTPRFTPRSKSSRVAWDQSRDRFCAMCNKPTGIGPWGGHVHHVVYHQHLIDYGGAEYDPRNGMTLCTRCHQAHHNRTAPIPLTKISNDAIRFAFDLIGPAAYDYLRRRYAGEDERLERELEKLTDAATA